MLGIRSIIGFVIFIYSLNSNAATFDYTLGLGVGYYKNVNLESVSPGDEFSESFRGTVSIIEDTSNLSLNINSRFDAIFYNNNYAVDRNLGSMTAEILWTIKPGQLEWYVSDILRQTVIDAFVGNTISNQQNANVLTTGPNYYIRLNSRNNINLEGRLSYYSYESYVNNTRTSGLLSWTYLLNPQSVWGLNYEVENTRFNDNTGDLDFDRNDMFISLQYQRGGSSLEAELGSSKITNKLIGEVTGSRYLLAISSERTRTLNIRIEYENNLSDTGRQLLTSANIVGSSVLLEPASSDTFSEKIYRVEINKRAVHGELQFYLTKRDYDYSLQNNYDRSSKGFGLSGAWRLLRSSSLRVYGDYLNTLYTDVSVNREDDSRVYGANYTYGMRRDLNISADIAFQRRDSTTDTASYDDIRFLLGFELLNW